MTVVDIDREPMQQFVARFHTKLTKFFSQRSRNRWDAEELIQEVYFKILNRSDMSLDQYSEPYVYTIAWSVLRDRARRDKVRHRDMHVGYDESFAKEDFIGPEKYLQGNELYARFTVALGDLTPFCREIFVLSRYEYMTYNQIATNKGISVSAVEKQMMLALKLLKKIV